MKFKLTTAVAISLGSLIALSVSASAQSAFEPAARSGELHVVKNCDNYNFQAGGYCTIKSSNVQRLTGATVFYDQAAGVPVPPTGAMLDSNVVLYLGENDWAVGRCTLAPTSFGLCTFSDGVGKLAGFQARLRVAPAASGGNDYTWDGPYSFF